MEPIEVTAQFRIDGQIVPLRFVLNGKTFPIESIGRNWQAEDGVHILVMIPGGKVVELILNLSQGRWYLRCLPASRSFL